MSSQSNSLPPILRLPPELRPEIYRPLLLSDRTVRMVWRQDDEALFRPNCLFPAILRTCHLIYNEAAGVLYGENVFRAHRIDDRNDNAASIKRAKFCIGLDAPDDAEGDACGLPRFLKIHPNLEHLVLQFGFDFLEDSGLRNDILRTLRTFCYSSRLTVHSAFQSTRSSFNAARLVDTVHSAAMFRNAFPDEFKKLSEKVLRAC